MYWICSLVRTSVGSFWECRNAVLANMQLRFEHREGYRVCAGYDGHSLYPGDPESEEERGGCASSLRVMVIFLLFLRMHLLLSPPLFFKSR